MKKKVTLAKLMSFPGAPMPTCGKRMAVEPAGVANFHNLSHATVVPVFEPGKAATLHLLLRRYDGSKAASFEFEDCLAPHAIRPNATANLRTIFFGEHGVDLADPLTKASWYLCSGFGRSGSLLFCFEELENLPEQDTDFQVTVYFKIHQFQTKVEISSAEILPFINFLGFPKRDGEQDVD